MPVYSLSPIYVPQYVAATALPLVFAPTPGGFNVVPAGVNYLINVARVSNVTNAPVWLQLWRVPNFGGGGTPTGPNLIVPQINIPVASQTFPYFDVTALWGIILRPGDAICAMAQAATSLSIHADGAVIVP